ncbi:MAG: hypothetical protein JW728_03510 [Candidatus Aureabacteria bacterium]|nr:hypothetical protein [Candidatus Auribacterota bacterium]
MRKIMLFLHLILFFFFFSPNSFCEVIHFKNGRSIEGKVVDKDNDFIKIRIKTGGEMIVPVTIVTKIEGYDEQAVPIKNKIPEKRAEDKSYPEINKDYLKIVDRIMKEDEKKQYQDEESDIAPVQYDESEIFREIVMMEGMLEEEAKQIYPDDKIKRQEYVSSKIGEIEQKIMEKYNITEEKLAEIKIAGLGIE